MPRKKREPHDDDIPRGPIEPFTQEEIDHWRRYVSGAWGIGDVSRLIGMHPESVRRYATLRKIPCIQIVRRGPYRFRPSEVISWWENRADGPLLD